MFHRYMNLALLGLLAASAAGNADAPSRQLYMDVHQLDSVNAADVAAAHEKDLAVQEKYGVNFIRYWVDEDSARVYCLAEAPGAGAVSAAHAEAHGLIPQQVHAVTPGDEAPGKGDSELFLDIHRMGAGKVTAADVAEAHEKDLAVQEKHGVHFINYWVDPDSGDIFCLSEADDARAVLDTHREAHGLVSDAIMQVQQGE
jgi:hypothetical protein